MARGNFLSREKHDALVLALALGVSQREAAARVGISQKAVWTRMQKSDFRAEIEAARESYVGSPPELLFIYESAARVRSVLETIDAFDADGNVDLAITKTEAHKHLLRATEWLDEWAWLLEEECAG